MLARLPLFGSALVLLLAVMQGRPDDKPPAAPPLDFIIDTPTRAVHVRLHLEIDGQPLEEAFRSAHREQLRALFPCLDRNSDGSLDESEARGVPMPLFQLPDSDSSEDVHVAYNFRALDLDGDGKVSPAELAGFYEEFEGGAFLTRTPSLLQFSSAQIDVAFFRLLDTDSDGKLSKQEIAKAADVLGKLDRAGDDVVTLAEVAPQQVLRGFASDEVNVNVPAQPGRSPITLDPQRLRAFTGVAPDLELRVRFGERRADAPLLEVIRPRGMDPLVSGVRKSEGGLLLTLDRARVELRLDRSRMTPRSLAALRDQAVRGFRGADRDGDGLVDQAEARRSVFLRDLFPILDRKGTGRVSEAQLREHCDRVLALQARTMARRVSLVASQGVFGLWDLLDNNRDGVLGLREVRSAPAVLTALDRNGDGIVERDEVPALYVLQLGLGQTDFRRLSGDDLVAFTADARLTYVSGTEGGGPLWFRKMDSNGDGDVSRREFLGPPEAFKKLDLDGDGLISREEAEKAK